MKNNIIAGTQGIETLLYGAIVYAETKIKTLIFYVNSNKNTAIKNTLKYMLSKNHDVIISFININISDALLSLLKENDKLINGSITNNHIRTELDNIIDKYPKYEKLSQYVIDNSDYFNKKYVHTSYDTQVKQQMFIKEFRRSISDDKNYFLEDNDITIDKDGIANRVFMFKQFRTEGNTIFINEMFPDKYITDRIQELSGNKTIILN